MNLFFAPKGLRISSPGLLRSSYPGTMGCGEATLGPWVASLFSQAPFTQPRWGWIFVRSLPRVAASPQPWANIRSPLWGQKSALPNPPGTLKPEEPKNVALHTAPYPSFRP
uniref:Uncharacterized protein n=1 Tax=Candidatus Kentrum sp. TUN TaxID=2126343 RepID=A0A451ACF1_9GAMM|nr:MAG: hypothetical protein BECKTUN1418D_GA0071000_12232 [Candidatus Kentron sp. TUN]